MRMTHIGTLGMIAAISACKLDSSLPQHTMDASSVGADTGSNGASMFSDDFETYAPGTMLAGRGGWYQNARFTAPLMLSAGSGLSSTVGSGLVRMGDGSGSDASFSMLEHALPRALGSSGRATLSVDAYAFTLHKSHDAGPIFTSSDLLVSTGWYAAWYNTIDREQPKWVFSFFNGASYSIVFHGAFDEPVRLDVIVDSDAGVTYGRITYSGGLYETPRYPITAAQIASLNNVALTEDFRDPAYLGIEYDNVRVVVE